MLILLIISDVVDHIPRMLCLELLYVGCDKQVVIEIIAVKTLLLYHRYPYQHFIQEMYIVVGSRVCTICNIM